VSKTSETIPGLDPNRWRTLFVVAIAQLMVVLDSSIVNIAIPSAKADLGITDANQQWVITAYTLAFGSLLLIGGRIGDFMGRKKIFLVGLIGFAAVSALGGIASTQELLFAARALQGVFGALLAPAALYSTCRARKSIWRHRRDLRWRCCNWFDPRRCAH
jgi:MFS family permease